MVWSSVRDRKKLLDGVMKMIDAHQDKDGFLPHIKKIVEQEKLHLPWLKVGQIYGLRRRRVLRYYAKIQS
jgi:hypothetical protein